MVNCDILEYLVLKVIKIILLDNADKNEDFVLLMNSNIFLVLKK